MHGTTGGLSSGSDGMRRDFAIRLRDVTLRLPTGRRRAGRVFRGLRKTIGSPWTADPGAPPEVAALDNVSLTIKEGRRAGIIGHNGAGKSVLLRVMAGIYTPTSGSCETRGQVSTMFSTSPGNYWNATGREYIMLLGLTRGLSRREVNLRTPHIIQFSGIGDYLNLPLRMYSVGMRSRLAFAIATCTDSEVLLIDENIGAVDLRFRARSSEYITRTLAATGTLVIASQDMRLIRELCDVAVWIHRGRLHGMGQVDEILDAYRSEQLEG